MVVTTQSEKRLVWHPRRDNKFVVGGGSQITLYEWAPDHPEIRHVTSQHDLQFMKCFAWSPNPAFDDLIAVGLSTGKVDLMRLEATKYARNNVLNSGPIVSLPVRNSRSCNALEFCNADPNYLAVGLDKVRGDCSLMIWDIHSASPSLSLSPNPASAHTTVIHRPQPQLPRMETGPRADNRVLQQHAPAEIVSSLAYLPQSTNLLLAGISRRWLRLFDLRASGPSVIRVASMVHGIATDPFDAHRIACFGDGIVTIWDARKLENPLLTFTEKDASADGASVRKGALVQGLEFSGTRRGTLAVLEKDGTYVRFWDLREARGRSWGSSMTQGGSSDGERSRVSSQSSRAPRLSWATLPWTGVSGTQTAPGESHSPPYTVVLADTRKTKHFNRPLASFALVPNPKSHPLTSGVMVVNKDGDLELYAVHDIPKQTSWSARGDLGIGLGTSFKVLPGYPHEPDPPAEPWDIPPSESVTRDESSLRGRRKVSAAPTFGKGTEDGFPSLNETMMKVKATARTYSPASLRTFPFESSRSHPVHVDRGTPDREINDESSRARSRRNRQGDRSVSRGKMQNLKTVGGIIADDVSMTMRHRVIHGYGLSDPLRNWNVTKYDKSGEALPGLWWWINHSRELLCQPTPRIHGYDFSYQGLYGIWDGFQPHVEVTPRITYLELPPDKPSERKRSKSRTRYGGQRSHSPVDDLHGDFQAAMAAIASRRGMDPLRWRPPVPTNKLIQRQVALQLCGWSLKEEELNAAIKRWEKEGSHSRAACWLVFTRQFTKAVDLLMRSKDESHHMMSGTLAALIPQESNGSNRSLELREHCERLIVRLQDPYFRALLTYLTLGDWSEVLEEEALPFRERLAIAFQFLDDKSISSYLRRSIESSSSHGEIEGLLVTGLTSSGMDILQSYIDRTGDIQTAAILSSYVSPSKFSDSRVDRWLEAYRDLLDGFKLWHHRVQFDIERGQILHNAIRDGDAASFEWAPRQILIRCNYCNMAISPPNPSVKQEFDRPTACPNCGRALPRCTICLMTLGVVQDAARDADLSRSRYKDTMDDAIVICQTCRHGGHASHILDWFFGEDGARSHGTCAVADCDCTCADEL